MARPKRPERDIQKEYPVRQFVAKLRRLADALERGKPFRIQIAGQRIDIPARAVINLEHERGERREEVEFQLVWSLEDETKKKPASGRKKAVRKKK
jgi:amphi-Trp domain-containing protein